MRSWTLVRVHPVFAVLPFFTAALAMAQNSPAVLYKLRYSGGDLVHVSITLPRPATVFVIPRAIPMGYGEQYFDRYVQDLNGKREEGPRWSLNPTRQITYAVNVRAMERDILAASDTSKLRDRYVGLLGYSIFGFAEGFEDAPVRLEIEAPADWPVFSTLSPRGGDLAAPNFYALADSQIALGPGLRLAKLDDNPPLYLTLYAEHTVDEVRIGRLAKEAMRAVTAYFGPGPAPFPHYTVHMEILEPLSPQHRYGFSMEHLDSGTFFLRPEDIADDRRTRFNFAHHFAHSWIPKRCYGPGYFPFRWELAPVLDSIWFAEGFGQYAAIRALSADEAEAQRYLDVRFRAWLREAPAFLRDMPLAELSAIGSTRYSEDFRVGKTLFSRGGLLAAELDNRIRIATGNRKSLRDALRHLIAWTAREKRAWQIHELPRLIKEATGVNTVEIFDKWNGPAIPPSPAAAKPRPAPRP